MSTKAALIVIVGVLLIVVTVAAFAGVVSYNHIFELGRAHGQSGTSARLTPLSVDLLILATTLVLLWASSNAVEVPWPVSWVLYGSVLATIAGNVLDGWADGPVGAVLNGWPGLAFVAAIEIAIWLVRAWRTVRAEGSTGTARPKVAADAESAAEVALRETWRAGNPLSQNQLVERFGLKRPQARELHERVIPKPPAGAVLPQGHTAPAGPSLALSNGSHDG